MYADNNKGILDFKGFVPESVKKLLELLQNQEVQAFLKQFIENSMITSDLKILKRLADIEIALGLNDYSDYTEEHEQTIPEQLSLLAERIDNITEPIQESVKPRTTLEQKATELVNHLKTVKPRNEEMFLESSETMHFLKCILPEPLRMKDIKNPRQFKRDVIQKAKNMFPNIIVLDKKKNGRRNVRVIYKPENDTNQLNRTYPYERPKPT